MSNDLHSLTGAYAADALDTEEREAFQDHLSTCASCAPEVEGLAAAAARLGAASAIEPPAHLKAEVMARLGTVRQLPPLVNGAIELPIQRERSFMRFMVAAAAAVVLAAGVSALWTADHYRGNAAQQAALTRVLVAPDARTVTSSDPTWAGARVVVSRTRGAAVLLAGDLAAPPSGRTYELWWLGSGKPKPAGTFVPGKDGVARLVKGALGAAKAVGVTVEPDGGSDQPTGEPVATFALPAA